MAIFHPFPRLATELRLQIWEYAVEPREIRIQHPTSSQSVPCSSIWVSTTTPPAALQACHESRQHLRGVYSQELRHGSRYIWLNPSLDHLRLNTLDLEDLLNSEHAKDLPFHELVLELTDVESFTMEDSHRSLLQRIRHTLKDLTVLSMGHMPYNRDTEPILYEVDDRWQCDSKEICIAYYWTCDPVAWRTRIINPELPHSEMNRDNFLRWCRNWRLSEYSGRCYDQSEAELREYLLEHVDDAGYYNWWAHDGCACDIDYYSLAQIQLDAIIKSDGPATLLVDNGLCMTMQRCAELESKSQDQSYTPDHICNRVRRQQSVQRPSRQEAFHPVFRNYRPDVLLRDSGILIRR